MGLMITEGGGSFKDASPGTHPARCVRLIDIGTQHGEYQGKATARKQIIVSWELPNELMDDGRPFIAGKRFSVADITAGVAAWLGEVFGMDIPPSLPNVQRWIERVRSRPSWNP